MTEAAVEFPNALEAADLYAAYAQAFRYPEDDDGVLSANEYLSAFDPAASETAVSLHEASHTDTDGSGLFEELVRFYEHFGLRRLEDAALPDHISVELEFLHFLCRLEHQAGDKEQIASARKAQFDFIDRHVTRLLAGLQRARHGRDGAASELVTSCAEFVAQHRHSLID